MNRIVRWSDDPVGLSLEECARRGIEAVAGFVISRDIFGTNNHPDAHFCACAEIHHVVTGASGNYDDHIGVSFRMVEIMDGTYPMVGPESVKMIMQPLSDGSISARWNAVGRNAPGGSPPGAELTVDDLDTLSGLCSPLDLGPIPEQVERDASVPSFLFLKDPGAGWQIWRRFLSAPTEGESSVEGEFREETFTMLYPLRSPYMNWRFRIFDLPGGGARWEVNSSNRE